MSPTVRLHVGIPQSHTVFVLVYLCHIGGFFELAYPMKINGTGAPTSSVAPPPLGSLQLSDRSITVRRPCCASHAQPSISDPTSAALSQASLSAKTLACPYRD